MPNPAGAHHHPLTAASTPHATAPYRPAILSEGYFSFCLFTSLPPSFFFCHSVPRLLPLPRNPERQHIKTGRDSRRWRREDLRNADIAFPRLSGPLPFGASVFFSFFVAERLDACLCWSSSRTFLQSSSFLFLCIMSLICVLTQDLIEFINDVLYIISYSQFSSSKAKNRR